MVCEKIKMGRLIKNYKYFKLNLPSTIDEYRFGNGEGVWAVAASASDNKLARDDSVNKQFEAYLCNDSVYYPHMPFGSRVLGETRGGCRPVAVWDDLQDTKNAPACRMSILNKIIKRKRRNSDE
jgi:hypothetical protein